MRSILAFTLLTIWLFGVVSDRLLGGLVHLLGLAAVAIVFTPTERRRRGMLRR